jgi:hypothetical protein
MIPLRYFSLFTTHEIEEVGLSVYVYLHVRVCVVYIQCAYSVYRSIDICYVCV